ncbi:Putative resolvase L103 [Geodia barretti]|uniref:Resolvase L103 n=1 Tax=Geodia barretti TaxID=519541 RepID=A0AA35RQJ4_GEOBA|nr:Putative resolvase L103 [Geodia barretti]
MRFVPSRIAARELGLHPNTLRAYADEGRIQAIKTASGQRRYDVDSYVRESAGAVIVCYCRVSSHAQRDDLARQVAVMRELHPDAEVIQDIGGGLNFRRKGLVALLERLHGGAKLRLVVAHKDRLARFGFDLIRWQRIAHHMDAARGSNDWRSRFGSAERLHQHFYHGDLTTDLLRSHRRITEYGTLELLRTL